MVQMCKLILKKKKKMPVGYGILFSFRYPTKYFLMLGFGQEFSLRCIPNVNANTESCSKVTS